MAKTIFSIWMIAGVVGLPISVGWLLYRWQKYQRTTSDHERVRQREKVRRALILMFVFGLILVGFVLYATYGGGKELLQQ